MNQYKRTVVVTGAAGELGRAIIAAFRQTQGTTLLAVHRRPKGTVAPASGAEEELAEVDLVEPRGLERLRARLASESRPLHLVHCAGYFPGYAPVDALSLAQAKRVFDDNILSLYGVASVLLPIMRRGGGGRIVAFSSHTGGECFPQSAAFNAAKQGVEALMRSIANENAECRITANTLALATVRTPAEVSLKPFGDHANWLSADEVALFVRDMVLSSQCIQNGNTIHLYHYSSTFFHTSYFDRIRRNGGGRPGGHQ